MTEPFPAVVQPLVLLRVLDQAGDLRDDSTSCFRFLISVSCPHRRRAPFTKSTVTETKTRLPAVVPTKRSACAACKTTKRTKSTAVHDTLECTHQTASSLTFFIFAWVTQ